MAPRLDRLDLSTLGLAPGAGRRLEVEVGVGELEFGGERYEVDPDPVLAALEISRLSGPGFAFRLSLECLLRGPCMRCLKDAAMPIEIEAREVETGSSAPSSGDESEDELASPYVVDDVLDLSAWARDALVLGLPAKILCREDCPGLCPVCAVDLSEVGEDHSHAEEPDPRWAKLRELRLD
jgi:DUF177 domain-containing protein